MVAATLLHMHNRWKFLRKSIVVAACIRDTKSITVIVTLVAVVTYVNILYTLQLRISLQILLCRSIV